MAETRRVLLAAVEGTGNEPPIATLSERQEKTLNLELEDTQDSLASDTSTYPCHEEVEEAGLASIAAAQRTVQASCHYNSSSYKSAVGRTVPNRVLVMTSSNGR